MCAVEGFGGAGGLMSVLAMLRGLGGLRGLLLLWSSGVSRPPLSGPVSRFVRDARLVLRGDRLLTAFPMHLRMPLANDPGAGSPGTAGFTAGSAAPSGPARWGCSATKSQISGSMQVTRSRIDGSRYVGMDAGSAPTSCRNAGLNFGPRMNFQACETAWVS